MAANEIETILLIEPFYCGSHKMLCDLIEQEFKPAVKMFTMPGKKWHWRARTSALYLAQIIPAIHAYKLLFASSVLNLAELIALRPDLRNLHKVLYFHENQLVYPVRKHQERDFQYGYNQVLSCLVADVIAFNSNFNKESFLKNLQTFFKLMPDHRPRDLEQQIRPKCRVLYFPLQFPKLTVPPKTQPRYLLKNISTSSCGLGDAEKYTGSRDLGANECIAKVHKSNSSMNKSNSWPLHIVWPHRWEHDKDPETFFSVLYQLQNQNVPFQISVLGETYAEIPVVFNVAKKKLESHIVHFGYLSSKEEYWQVLQEADVAVSTAKHEFFGVAMLEAVYCKCYPLCPRSLVYPEIFPDEYLYSTSNQLFKLLRRFCLKPSLVRNHVLKVDLSKFTWDSLKNEYQELLQVRAKERR